MDCTLFSSHFLTNLIVEAISIDPYLMSKYWIIFMWEFLQFLSGFFSPK